MLIQMVDAIFADVAQPDQARIIALNAHHFLKNGGGIIISIKANCIDSTAPAAQVFASEVNNMRKEGIKPKGKFLYFSSEDGQRGRKEGMKEGKGCERMYENNDMAEGWLKQVSPLIPFIEQLTLEPYERDHAMVVGIYERHSGN